VIVIVDELSERDFPVGQVNFTVTNAQLAAAGVTAAATQMRCTLSNVGWPAGPVVRVRILNALGNGGITELTAGGTKGPPQIIVGDTDAQNRPVPVLDLAPYSVRVEVLQAARAAIVIEAVP
jgi:hypothetical protein